MRYEVQYKTQYGIRWQSCTQAVRYHQEENPGNNESGGDNKSIHREGHRAGDRSSSGSGGVDGGDGGGIGIGCGSNGSSNDSIHASNIAGEVGAGDDDIGGKGDRNDHGSCNGSSGIEKHDRKPSTEAQDEDGVGRDEFANTDESPRHDPCGPSLSAVSATHSAAAGGTMGGEDAVRSPNDVSEVECGCEDGEWNGDSSERPDEERPIAAAASSSRLPAPNDEPVTPGPAAQQYTMRLTGLRTEECYSVRLRACLDCGYSEWSPVLTRTPRSHLSCQT